MKKLMILLLLTAMNAMGVVVSDVITCRIEVKSGTKSTIVSLPFTELGGNPVIVELDKIVLKDNLENGTLLFAVTGGKTHAWMLANGAWMKVDAVDGFEHTSDIAGINSFTRGNAFWIERAGDAAAIAKPFYIYGLVGARMPARQAIAPGVQTAERVIPAYTRIGNPNPEDRDLNDLTWSGRHKDDLIVIATSKADNGFYEFAYNPAEGKWGVQETYKSGKATKRRWNHDLAKLPAGEAFWYVRRGTGDAEVSF